MSCETLSDKLPAKVLTQPDAIQVRGDTPLSLKDYKIEGLSKMMGMLKMYDKIVVHLDLRFVPTGGTLDSGIRRSGS